jgi:hypothetical protein
MKHIPVKRHYQPITHNNQHHEPIPDNRLCTPPLGPTANDHNGGLQGEPQEDPPEDPKASTMPSTGSRYRRYEAGQSFRLAH